MSKPHPKCPNCGEKAVRSETRYGLRFDHCGLYSWGPHPLVSPETHKARRAAHAAFDPVWQSGRISRSSAYKRLSEALGIRSEDTHMKLMDEATARRVPAIAAELLARLQSEAA